MYLFWHFVEIFFPIYFISHFSKSPIWFSVFPSFFYDANLIQSEGRRAAVSFNTSSSFFDRDL